MRITQKARDISIKTTGAYSADRFKNWAAVAQALLDLGLTELQAEAVMLSKWARWACDTDESGNRYGYHTSSAMTKFMLKGGINHNEIKKLTFETFGVTQ